MDHSENLQGGGGEVFLGIQIGFQRRDLIGGLALGLNQGDDSWGIMDSYRARAASLAASPHTKAINQKIPALHQSQALNRQFKR